jgi:hypothetical protein
MMEGPDERTEAAETSPSKRALLKSVWVAPVVLSMALPRAVMAQGSLPPPAPPPAPPSTPP